MWSTRLISDNGLTRQGDGFRLDIRFPWYRSLPLSVLRGLDLKVDEQPVAATDMTLEVNGQRFSLDDLEHRVDDWWHVLDSGYLLVDGHRLEPGSEHKLDLTFTFEIPYVANAVVPSRCVKTLEAA